MEDNLIENQILASLKENESVNSQALCKELIEKFPEHIHNHQELYSVLLSLETLTLICLEKKSETVSVLTPEGELYLNKGTPEFCYAQVASKHEGMAAAEFNKVFESEIPQFYTKEELEAAGIKADSLAKVAFPKAKQNGYITLVKGAIGAGKCESDKFRDILKKFSEKVALTADETKQLKARKLLHDVPVTWFIITKGPKYVEDMSKFVKPVVDLTEEMVKSGEWKTIEFAPLNFEAMGTKVSSGHLHPLMKVRQEFRQVFLSMGFEEMDTSNWVEESFWNFDTLFQGQQHPCRDMHDTFFIDSPQKGKKPADEAYFQRVKEMHEKGGDGSIGLRYEFSEDIPLHNIMRTHTTAVSSRYLKKIADHYKETGEISPGSYFSIDRVYRNETLDATHLAEFMQVEGFVIGKDLSLGDLMNITREFFGRIGLPGVYFKPAYNPYTEPSEEIFCFHPGLGKPIEVGNSGMFRPEMLSPMGIPEGWNVIAWGFSLERPTMIEYGIDKISQLEGPKVPLDFVENAPIARLTF